MTVSLALDIGLMTLILTIGVWTIVVRETFAAIIGFVVYGLILTAIWVRLSAVDVALTEAAISGMTGMLLLGLDARLSAAKVHIDLTSAPVRFLAGIVCSGISAVLATAVLFLPNAVPTLAPIVMENMTQTGLGNPVAGVLFAFRAFDTLLEKVVLLLALLGIWSMASDRGWGGIPSLRVFSQPSSPLIFLAQLLPPIGIVVGVYLSWVGASEPGGAFQGGTILAAMWILVMVAGLQGVPAIDKPWLRRLLTVGPAIFLAIGIAGFVLAGAFLAYPPSYAKPLIITIEAALTLSIAVTLGMLAAGSPERRPP